MAAPITAAATNSIERKSSALPRNTVAKKRSSCRSSRSRSTPIDHRKATPANGTRFKASVIRLVLATSHAPESSGSSGIDGRSSAKIANINSENTIPATAAAFGVFSRALTISSSAIDIGPPRRRLAQQESRGVDVDQLAAGYYGATG